MAFVVSAVSAAVGGGILGAMAGGAVAGGLVSAVTGGNVLQGALMGGITGGIGSGIAGAVGGSVGGWLSGATDAAAPVLDAGALQSTVDFMTSQGGIPYADAVAQVATAANVTPDAVQGILNAGEGSLTLTNQAAAGVGGATEGLNSNTSKLLGTALGNVLGSVTQYNAAGKATTQNVSAIQAAQQAQLGVYNQQRADQAPYMAAGTTATNALTAGIAPGGQFNKPFTMADAQNMPAYQFALQQGQEALGNQAAMGGQQLSANNLSGQTKLAEGLAAQYENQAFNQNLQQNQLALGATQNLANLGQEATARTGTAAQNYSTNVGQNLTNIGATQAAGTVLQGNAVQSGINSAVNTIGQMLGQPSVQQPSQTPIVSTGITPTADVTSSAVPGISPYTFGSANAFGPTSVANVRNTTDASSLWNTVPSY